MEDVSTNGSVIPNAWPSLRRLTVVDEVDWAPDLLHDACAGGLSSTCEVNAWNNLSGDRIEEADDPVIETVARTPMVPRCF